MSVSITLTESQFYLAIIIILLVLQVYQQYQVHRLKKNLEGLWGQFAVVVLNVGTKIQELELKSENKQAKQQQQDETKN